MHRFLRICMWVALVHVLNPGLSAAVAPTITSSRAESDNVGEKLILKVGSNQVATAYYVVSQTDLNPTAAQVRSGMLEHSSILRGSFFANPGSDNGALIYGVGPGKTYFVYFILENANGEQSTVGRISVVATDSNPPYYVSASIVNITGTQFDLKVNISERSTVYYVVSTHVGEPSAKQIMAGHDDTGSAAFTSGFFAVNAASMATSTSITGLSNAVRYYVYSAAEDVWGNVSTVNFQSTTTAGSTCTPDNVTTLAMRDKFYDAVLTWTNPTCFDEIMVVGRRNNPVTLVPSGDGSAYTANRGFGTNVNDNHVLYRGTGTTVTATGMSYVYCYYTVFTRSGTTWSSGVTVSGLAMNPDIASVYPVDNSTNVPTNQVYTITFTEPVFISTAFDPCCSSSVPYILFNTVASSGRSLIIYRNSIGGDGTISIEGNVVTLNLDTEPDIASRYSVTVFPGVFVDEFGNDFGGSNPKGFMRFNTVTTGTTVNAPTAEVCTDQYIALGDIVLTEVANNNFQGTDDGTLTLALEFNKTGFSFRPATDGVTATAAADGDIESVTVTSVSATQALFAVKFKDVANNGEARDHHDAITLSGLKVSRTGASVPPASVVLGASGTLRIQGVKPGTTVLANLTAGTMPVAPAVAWADHVSTYCQGTDLSSIAVTASEGTSYNWYSDASLTTLIASGTSSQTAAQLFGTSPGDGVTKRYVTNVNGCESVATEVTLTILAAPVVDAGSIQAVCPPASVTLGGDPTASGGAGNYTYAWTGTDGLSSTDAHPIANAPVNTTDSDIINVYTVVVKDANQCQASDEITVIVNTIAQAVSITTPHVFTHAMGGAAVSLQGSPAGGIFTGPGVVQSNGGAYQFDPTVATIGQWPVTYTARLSNGCEKSAVQDFTVTDVVTSNEPSLVTQVDLYPNPVNTLLSIAVPENTPADVTLRMIDPFGREAVVTAVKRGERYATIDTRAFSDGVYIVKIEASNGVVYRRVVVAH